jgi:hypothetical protein
MPPYTLNVLPDGDAVDRHTFLQTRPKARTAQSIDALR